MKRNSKKRSSGPASRKRRKGKIKPPTAKRDEVAITERLNEAAEGQYNIRQLSLATGFNHESVRRWMVGMQQPPTAFLCEFCRLLDVSADWLLMGKGKGPGKRGR